MPHVIRLLCFSASLCGLVSHTLAQDATNATSRAARAAREVADSAASREITREEPSASDLPDKQAPDRFTNSSQVDHSIDFAELMPADSVAYAEITEPGSHLARLADLLGLIQSANDSSSNGRGRGIPLGDGLFIPDNIAISRELIAEVERIAGAAAAITEIDERGKPSGIVVVHPGRSHLIRGLIETGVQFLKPLDNIRGYRTYTIEDEIHLALTHDLLMISNSRLELERAANNLSGAKSLADDPTFAALSENRREALGFAYASGPALTNMLEKELRGQEGAIARNVLDLPSFRSVSASLGETEDGLQLDLKVHLDEGHQNLAYGLIRTAPITQATTRCIPAESAALALIGLNPRRSTSETTGQQLVTPFSALAVGRELFHNIS